MMIEFNNGGYTDIPSSSNIVEKIQRRILSSKKYKRLIHAGYVPEFSLKEDFTAIQVQPAVCVNGHPLFNMTQLCLHDDCDGSKRIVYQDA